MEISTDYGTIRNIAFPQNEDNDFGIKTNSSIDSFVIDKKEGSSFISGILSGYSKLFIAASEETKTILFGEDKYKCIKDFCNNRLLFESNNRILCLGNYFADFPERIKEDFLDREVIVVYVKKHDFCVSMIDDILSSLGIEDELTIRKISFINKQKES
jgi:hypothetical protein